jgi:hypothetical protein
MVVLMHERQQMDGFLSLKFIAAAAQALAIRRIGFKGSAFILLCL